MTSRYMYLFKSFTALAAFQAAMHLQPTSLTFSEQPDEEALKQIFDDNEEVDTEQLEIERYDSPNWHGQQRALRYHR